MSKKLCEVCHVKPATVPDRERMGRPINRVCSGCHSDRLRGDWKVIAQKRAEAIRQRQEAEKS